MLYCLFLSVIAAFELSLAEGNHLEKRLFHATFATVSKRTHWKHVGGGGWHLMFTVQSFNLSVWVSSAGGPQRRHDSICGKEKGHFPGQVEKSHTKFLILYWFCPYWQWNEWCKNPDGSRTYKLFKVRFGTEWVYKRVLWQGNCWGAVSKSNAAGGLYVNTIWKL